jgi:putative DNA primase/helicase
MITAEIAAALGAAQRCGQWWRCVCPVHGSRTGRTPTLSLRDGERGVVVWCWAGCDPRDVLSELRQRGLIDGRSDCRGATPAITYHQNRDGRIRLSREMWAAGRDARRTPVVQYLADRGIIIEPSPVLRWAPHCWHREARARVAAMLARVDGSDGRLVGVHRTYLRRDGGGKWRRSDRASLGPIAGGAVRLAPAAETLIVGEGIETTLAAMTATSLPGWAALSTAGLVALTLPPIVRDVVVLADHDISGAGERAARSAAARWLAEGRRVRIALPPEPGTDFNDVLVGCAGARIIEARHVAP